jgi:LysM repeat protein
MIIRDLIIKEHRVLTESQARAQLMEDPVFRHARQFGQLLVEYNLTKAQVQQLFKDVEQGATAAGSNRTGLGKAKDYTTKTIGNIISGARKWVKERPTYQAVDAEYNRAMTALGKLGGENGEANAITKAIYKYRDAAKQYPRATGLAKWAIITAAGLATGGVGGAGVAAGLAAIDSAIKDKEIVDIVGDAAAAALVSGAAQGAAELGGQAMDAYRGLPSDAAVAANNAALGGFNDSGVPGGAASNINGLDLPANAATGDGTAMGDTTPSISGGQDIGGYNPDNVPAGTYTVTADDFKGLGKIAQDNGLTAQQLWDANPQITDPNKIFIGQEINIPAAGGEPVKNVWQGWEGPTKSTAGAVEPGPSDTVPALPAASGQIGTPFNAGNAPIGPNGQPMRLMPMNDGPTNLTKDFNPDNVPAGMTIKQGPTPVRESVWSKVAESVKVKVLPNNQLIDSKFTVYAWALNESTNRDMGRSLQLTRLGVRTVFENIGRYRRAYLKEYTGAPTADYGHPTAAGAPASATAGQGKPQSWFGRQLDTIGRGVDKVGSWASNVGHNVITKVTADKLNNMWNRAGEPYDSDRLYQLLTTDWGVPKQVVDSVYQRMNLSVTPAAAATPAATTTPTTGATKPATNTFPGEDPQGPGYVGRREVARRQAARGTTASKPAAPNFAQQGGGYAKVNQPTTMKYSGVPMTKPAAVPTSLPADKTSEYVNALAKRGAGIDAERNNPAMAQLESLSWSRKFNPGMTLFRQMKQEQS